mmetsp:Transcript_11850/g.14908  ORF Transcript_11850/g.14908 Transcript_11850/m.14908 type:complete len:330 (+) Transcript_11850:3-992(+)
MNKVKMHLGSLLFLFLCTIPLNSALQNKNKLCSTIGFLSQSTSVNSHFGKTKNRHDGWKMKSNSLSMSLAEDSEDNSAALPLEEIARRMRMQVFDLDEGVYGLDSTDVNYGIEIVKVQVSREPSLGLSLVEMMSGGDGRGLVLIDGITEGGNAEKAGKLKVGDTISWVGIEPNEMKRVEATDFDTTVDALGSYADKPAITVVAKRLVKREELDVTLVQPDGSETVLKMLAGSNLRGEMVRQGLTVYDPSTKRYDQPYVTGNCGGEGICGTCLVEVVEGKELLSEPDRVESMVLEKRPVRWRLSCRTIVGATNTPGSVTFKSMPQMEQKE